MIFYFTGTGNDLFVARTLGEALGDEWVSIARVLDEARIEYPRYDAGGEIAAPVLEARRFEAERIVIVSPVYGHELPAPVELFLRSFELVTPYLAFVLTYGNRTGDVVEYVARVCGDCGLAPAYVQTLLMVDNWLPDYDIEVQRAKDKGTDAALAAIASDLLGGRRWIKPVTEADRAAHRELLARGFELRPWRLVDFLTVTDRCIGCGLCVQTCPCTCIVMDGERARRDALTGWGCCACLACINVCPSFAYDCALGEANPSVHYRHPAVTIPDLIRSAPQ